MSDYFGNIPIQGEKPPSTAKGDGTKEPVIPVKKAPAKLRKRRRLWPWLTALLVLSALYSAIGFLGIPYYFTEILAEKFTANTGLVVESDPVRFNPLTFRLRADGIKITTKSGTVIVSIRSLVTDLAPLSLLRRDIVCNTLTVEELSLNLTRELDGSYNFQDIPSYNKDNGPVEIMPFSALPFFFSLNNIVINNGRATFNDLPTNTKHVVENIHLELPSFANISSQADQYLRPQFSAVVNGSPIELSSQIQTTASDDKRQSTNLSCDIQGFDLPLYVGYLPFELPFTFKRGKADGRIEVSFDLQGEKNIFNVGFDLEIADLELADKNKSMALTTQAAQLSGKLQPASGRLALTKVIIDEPIINSYGRSVVHSINQFNKKNSPATVPRATKDTSLQLSAEFIGVENGIVRLFKDKKDKYPTTTWKSIRLHINNYGIADTNKGKYGANSSLQISGKIDDGPGQFSWQAKFSSPTDLIGPLSLTQVGTNKLLEVLGADYPFQLGGIADLNGQLLLYKNVESPSAIAYKLNDLAVSIQDFKLIDEKKTVLQTPTLKIVSMNLVDGKIDFGKISLAGATAQFTYPKIPKPLLHLTSGKYHLRQLDFEGSARLDLPGKDGKELVLSRLFLKAKIPETAKRPVGNLTISGKTASGGIFTAHGDTRLAPFSLTLTTEFSKLAAKEVLPFFSSSSLVNKLQGELAGRGSFTLPQKSFTGTIQMANVLIKDDEIAPISWGKSTFTDLNYSAKPLRLELGQAKIDHGEFTWTIGDKDPLQQLADLCQDYLPTAKKNTTAINTTVNSAINIKEISITNGVVHLHDRRLAPAWIGKITNFTGSIKNISANRPGILRPFIFYGNLNTAPFNIKGMVGTDGQERNGEFTLSLENYPLASFARQLSAKTDVDTAATSLNLTLNGTWKNGKSKSSGSLILQGIEPLDITADSALPLAFLAGTDDSFELNFDLFQTEPALRTVLFEELLSRFQTLIVKGTLSPLLLADGDFTDLIDNNFAEFEPGSFILLEKAQKMLNRYAALLLAHPRIGLELSGGVDRKIDTEALKAQLEAVELQRVEKENKRLFGHWQAQRSLYEKEHAQQGSNTEFNNGIVESTIPNNILGDFIPILAEPVVIRERMLLKLAQQRIDVLRRYFTALPALQKNRVATTVQVQHDGLARGDRPANGVIIGLQAIDSQILQGAEKE